MIILHNISPAFVVRYTKVRHTSCVAFTAVAEPGLSEDENFNKKPNNAKKTPEKGQTTCLKARKKPHFICGIAIPLSQKAHKLQAYPIFSSKLRLNIAWRCTGALIFLDFSVCEIAHSACSSATVCILIYRQLSAPIRKSSSTNSCIYDQNH